MMRASRFVIIALAMAVGTWLIGWTAVPVLALVAGIARVRPGLIAFAAALGWLLLFLIDAIAGITRLSAILGGVMGLPAPAIVAVTLAFPALLAWSAASVADAALRIGMIRGETSGSRG